MSIQPATPSDGNGPVPNNVGFFRNPAGYFNTVSKLVEKAFGEAPWWLKGFVWVSGLCALCAFFLSIVFLWYGERAAACLVALLAFCMLFLVLLAIFKVVVLLIGRRNGGGDTATITHKSEVPWSRTVPKLPLPAKEELVLSDLVGELRTEALNWLQNTKGLPLQDKHIRANMFFAWYETPPPGFVFDLYMPQALQKNMNYAPERSVRFKPGQGATGLAFYLNQPQFSVRGPAGKDWEEVFEVPDSVSEFLHKDLKWVVSMPVHIGGSSLAVANVDGLAVASEDGPDYTISPSDLKALATHLIALMKIPAMYAVLAGCKQVKIGPCYTEVD